MPEDYKTYCDRRAKEEWKRATASNDVTAALVHSRMAQAYEQRAADWEARVPVQTAPKP